MESLFARVWGTGIDILIYIIEFACSLYLVCHEKPELMLQVRFTTSSCVESSAEKSFKGGHWFQNDLRVK